MIEIVLIKEDLIHILMNLETNHKDFQETNNIMDFNKIVHIVRIGIIKIHSFQKVTVIKNLENMIIDIY
jgi:hypothetical protein